LTVAAHCAAGVKSVILDCDVIAAVTNNILWHIKARFAITDCLCCKSNKYVGPTCSRTKIYAARMSCGSSSYRSIDFFGCAPTLYDGSHPRDFSSKPAGRRCCCRSTGQTDVYRILCTPRNKEPFTLRAHTYV